MGNIRILSRAGYQDISAWREEALNNINSTIRMSYDDAKFDMTQFTVVEMNIYTDDNFQVASPILIFSKANGKLIAFDGGFYLSVVEATLDIAEATYYYSLDGDSELLLTGKFVIVENPKTT